MANVPSGSGAGKLIACAGAAVLSPTHLVVGPGWPPRPAGTPALGSRGLCRRVLPRRAQCTTGEVTGVENGSPNTSDMDWDRPLGKVACKYEHSMSWGQKKFGGLKRLLLVTAEVDGVQKLN